MNEKQAREIVKEYGLASFIFDKARPNVKAYFIAEGYLKGVADERKRMLEQTRPLLVAFIRDNVPCQCHPPSEHVCKRCEVLSNWHFIQSEKSAADEENPG